jgi:hypothetical protein
MARSEEQKKDLKFKLYVAAFLAMAAAPILILGPALPGIMKKYEADPTHPDSAKRMLICIQIQWNTMRGEEAKKNLEKWIEIFVDEESKDFDGVMSGSGEWVMKKYEMGDGLLEEGFTPWLFPEGKPPAKQSASDDLVGEALDLYAKMLEDQKEYPKAAHICVCLANMWPNDSESQLLGEDGIKRAAIRSF